MSQGIKSIWRTRSKWLSPASSGLLRRTRFSAAATPALAWRFQSTSTSALSTALEPGSQPWTQLIHTKHARNQMFRDAFRERSPALKAHVEQKLSSPFVPTTRGYPSTVAARQSVARSRRAARVQVAFDIIWRHFGANMSDWTETFNLLKKMTTKRSETTTMAAVRIVLPKSWDLAVGNKRVDFVDSATGLAARLRVSADHQNPSAIILRGESSVLAKAADELVAACKNVEVFRLGEVAAFGYEVKRLWPAIDDLPDGGSSLPADKLDNIWVHKENQPYWIERPYEHTPKPNEWTAENFETYVTTLVCGRLHPHLALRFYKQRGKDGNLIDTDGIRINMILQAFMDLSARACVTPSVLKMAMSFMAHKGGHRAAADRLLTMAEEWGMPMDTEVFNIMFESYVAKRDATFFHKFLLKMEERYFRPNARTWLLFLELVQREDERRQIIVAMYELGLFEDPATRRGIARIMASHDAYVAFRAGKKLDVFMAEQKTRYGEDWFTAEALDSILIEFFRFHQQAHGRSNDFKVLVEKQSEDGRKLDIGTINLVLEHCVSAWDWDTALWALSKLPEYNCEPDARTYQLVIKLAVAAQSPNALGVAFFYGALDRKLRQSARVTMRQVLVGHTASPFWTGNRPRIFSKKIARLLDGGKVPVVDRVVPAVEWAILRVCDGYEPVKPLAASLGVALRTMDGPMHQQLKDPKREGKVQVGDFAMKLRRRGPDGETEKMVVHLDGRFVPERMVRSWNSDKEKRSRDFLGTLTAAKEGPEEEGPEEEESSPFDEEEMESHRQEDGLEK